VSTLWLELTPTAFRVDYVDVNGIRTRTLIAGDGPDVVFSHGTSGSLEAFVRNISAHVEAGYRVHAIDLLGHGYTDKPNFRYEIPRYVEHLLGYLDVMGIERAHLAGESLGGWVSARLASEYPQRVASLQLIAAGGTKANPPVMERIKKSTTEAVLSSDRELTRARLRLLHHDPDLNATEELVDVRYRYYHLDAFQENLPNLLCLQEMEIRQRNLLTDAQMAAITAPTLVIWGHENPFGDVPEARLMHGAIAGSRLELFAECGHWPQHEQADRYNQLSIEFLRESGN
jgi:2-hydroxy-6-oxonona-2,4-dienedioate hydrolase